MKKLYAALLATGLMSNAYAGPFNIDAGDNNGFVTSIGPGQRFESDAECTANSGTVTAIPFAPSVCTGYSFSQSGTNVSNLGYQIDEATSVYYDVVAPGSNVGAGDFFTDVGSGELITLEGGSDLSDSGYNEEWSLTFDYSLYGFVAPVDGTLAGVISGGFINIFYNDLSAADGSMQVEGTDSTQVLSVAIDNSSGPLTVSVGLNLFGYVDYSGSVSGSLDTSDPFVTDFFNFVDPVSLGGVSSSNFYDLWVAGVGTTPNEYLTALAVTTLNGLADNSLDDVSNIAYGPLASINIDQNEYSSAQNTNLNQDVLAAYGIDATTLLAGNYASGQRTGEKLSGNLSFAVVPEPSSIAIFAIGLIALSSFSRNKAK
ncbi:PEP-CTERM sorting domain-containing protein [Alteromonas sp. Cnat3-28]|uniref:PEP-CTERM sorting domain-containing protein n=1 Tax=Alteromonas sp. Cnat3-28 TaxID=2917729 RepID=UPI001EF5BFF3|nr:PEP-CTERM sorting domain-containing protein [Alteromonas sp. Cnat3-28]MCG7644885.1 PEP-CTERM sorting domain-containing protein [Alteromonas sp. Cnat3-28]